MIKRQLRIMGLAIIALLIMTGMFSLSFAADAAGLNPGEAINASNVEKYKDFLSPGVNYLLANEGMVIEIGEAQTFEHHPKYKDYTAKYSPQVTLDKSTNYFQNYVRGLPFPDIDINDPQVGYKVGYNVEYRLRPDKLLYEYIDLVYRAKNNKIERILSMKVHQLYWLGRAVLDEIPNPERVRWQEFVAFSNPLDVAGVSFLIKRYIDPAKIDDSWAYIPAVRRIRRMPSAQRSDPLLGSDWSLEDMYCYNDKVEDQDWKFIKKQKMYQQRYTTIEEGRPTKWGGKNGWCLLEQPQELRDVYVVNGIPKNPRHPYSGRVMYIDSEWFDTPQADCYDKKGELWKILFEYTFYDPKMKMLNWAFANAIDIQHSHCTPVLYKIAINEDTEAFGGVKPEYFSTTVLKKYGYGRILPRYK